MKTAFLPVVVLACAAASCGDAEQNDPVAVQLAIQSQDVSYTHYMNGQQYLYMLEEKAEDKSVPYAQKKMKELLKSAQNIDRICEVQISLLDALRRELLKGMGEELQPVGGTTSVLAANYLPDPVKPDLYTVSNVKYVGETNFLFDNAKEIRSSMQQFRQDIISALVASASTQTETYSFQPTAIGKFRDQMHLNKLVEKQMEKARIHPDDREMIQRMYVGLSYSDDTWKQLLHTDCSWESVFSFLTGLQTKVLEARGNALALIWMRTGCCDSYSFNKIAVCTPGPEYVKAGEEVSFEVFMAAFDSYNQPIVKVSAGNAQVSVTDGKAKVTLTAPKAKEMELTGTITILNKSGIPKTLPWRKKIVIGD